MAQSHTGGGTSSRRHRDAHHDSNTLGSTRYDTEWEAREVDLAIFNLILLH